MKLFGTIMLPQDAATIDEGMINVLVNYFNQGGEFMWPVLIILIVGLAIAFERVIQLIPADVNTRKFILHVKEILHSMSDLRNSTRLFSLTQTLGIMNRYKLLALIVLLSCAACEDAAVTRVNESHLPGDEVQPHDKTGSQLAYKSSHDNCWLNSGSHNMGSGELFINACAADDSSEYESRAFSFIPLMGGTTIERQSYAEGCNETNSQGFNLAIGLERIVTCRPPDGKDSLLAGITYSISSGHSEFFARWPDASASYPDVWATSKGGTFVDSLIGCASTATCTNTKVPLELEYCFAFLVYGGLSERGGGSEGCGPDLQWAIGGRVLEPNNDGRHSARLVRVLVDSANPSMAYDWAYSSDKNTERNHDTVIFAKGVKKVDLDSCSAPVAAFGYSDGKRDVVEGWAYDYVGIVKNDFDNTCDDNDT